MVLLVLVVAEWYPTFSLTNYGSIIYILTVSKNLDIECMLQCFYLLHGDILLTVIYYIRYDWDSDISFFLYDLLLRGPSPQKKKNFFIYAPILMGFFSSEVKFNFETLLFMSIFDFFFIYKKLQLFFDFLKIFIFLLVLHILMDFFKFCTNII